MNEAVVAPTPPRPPGIVGGAIDLLLRPAAFFQDRRPTITGKPALIVVVVMGLEIFADRYESVVQRLGRASPITALAGLLLSSLFIVGPLRYFIGGAWCRLRIRFSGALDVDPEEARAIFALAEIIRSVALLAYTLLDLALSPVRPWLSPTILLATAWSQVVSYQGVRATFPVSAWKARLWFLLVPGLFYGWMYWKLF